MAYESFVGQRYLMSKRRSRVLSIITLIAVGGVGLGVTALIVVLSVMGGFTEDLTSKILGARAHLVIEDTDGEALENAGELADEAMTVDGVIGASPYLEGEVMVSSPTNLGGVVLRGVDVDRVRDVSVLLRDLEHGELDYLVDDSPLADEIEQRQLDETEALLDELSRERDDDMVEIAVDDDAQGAQDYDAEDEPSAGAMPPLPDGLGEADQTSGEDETQSETDAPEAEPPEESEVMPPIFDDDAQGELPPLPGAEGADEANEADELNDAGAMPPIFDAPQSSSKRTLPGIVIGTELATSLRVELGDEINVVTPQGDMGPTGPMPRSRPYRVVGIFYSGMYEYDANHAYTALNDATRLFGEDGPTGVELRAADVEQSVDISRVLRDRLGSDYRISDWQDLNSSLFFALRLERIAMFVILTFIILVASFSIVAMLIMIVIEKAREIAILKSMGATNGGIMRIFIYQGLMIGVSGALLGLVTGLGLCHLLTTVGLPLDPDVYYITTVPVDINPTEVTAVVVCAIVISFLATLYPSYQAARLNPVEGLRHD